MKWVEAPALGWMGGVFSLLPSSFFLLTSQIIPGHFIGFWQVEEGDQGGGNVAQGAAFAEFSLEGGVNEYKGYGVGGVCGVGFAGVVV